MPRATPPSLSPWQGLRCLTRSPAAPVPPTAGCAKRLNFGLSRVAFALHSKARWRVIPCQGGGHEGVSADEPKRGDGRTLGLVPRGGGADAPSARETPAGRGRDG